MGSLSTGFRALKGTVSLFLPHYFCILNVSSQDKCPSPCFTARRDFASCGFSASYAVPSLAGQGAAGQSHGWFRGQWSQTGAVAGVLARAWAWPEGQDFLQGRWCNPWCAAALVATVSCMFILDVQAPAQPAPLRGTLGLLWKENTPSICLLSPSL